jgi:hypothetical protein
MKTTQEEEYESLTEQEKKIYGSIMQSFPSTKHESAYDIAIQGGVRWNFIFK